jgi:hypothetical protein
MERAGLVLLPIGWSFFAIFENIKHVEAELPES